MRRCCLCLVVACWLAATPVWAADPAAVSVAVNPESIRINALYNGMDLTVTGRVPAGSEVVLRLLGEDKTFSMRQKGKVFGLLWMNLDKVSFTGAPNVFLAAASGGAPEAARVKFGIPGLADRITVAASDPDKGKLVGEFLKYQKMEKLYQENAGTVSLGPDADGSRPFEAVIHMPSRLSPGAYRVEVVAVNDGQVVGEGKCSLDASFVGIPAFLYKAAFEHGTLYGVMASVIAILGGLVISQIFNAAKGKAR